MLANRMTLRCHFLRWCAVALLLPALCWGCGGTANPVGGIGEVPPGGEGGGNGNTNEGDQPPGVQGGGTSAGNPGNPTVDDGTAGGPTGEPIPQVNPTGNVQWQLVPLGKPAGEEWSPFQVGQASCGCRCDTIEAPTFVIGRGPEGDQVINLYDRFQEILDPTVFPLESPLVVSSTAGYAPFPVQVATHPKGGIVFLLSSSIPFHGVPCQFFALNNTLDALTCIDPVARDFGILTVNDGGTFTANWEVPASQRLVPIQFDAQGNIYYRIIPVGSDCEGSSKELLNPQAQIRRWDRETGRIGTYPLGAFSPYQFQVVADGTLIVTGYDMTAGADDALILRQLMSDGTGHQLQSTGLLPATFRVVNDDTLLLASQDKKSLVAVPFGPNGFGAPSPLVRASDGLMNAAGFLFGGKMLYAQMGSDDTLYTLLRAMSSGGLGPPGTNAIVKAAPSPPQLVEPLIPKVKFFRIDGDQLFVVGRNQADKAALMMTPLASPGSGVDLFGTTAHNVTNFFRVGDHVYFASGFIWNGPSYELGRVDLAAEHHVEVLAEFGASYNASAPRIHPFWPTEPAVAPLPPTDLTEASSVPMVDGLGCPKTTLDLNALPYGASTYLVDMQGTSETMVDLKHHLATVIWPQWQQEPYSWNIDPTLVITHPKGGVVFLNGRFVEFGKDGCALFRLDPSLQQIQCIDPTASYFGFFPEPWGQPPSLRRQPIQFDAEGNVYYRYIAPLDYVSCERGVKAALNPRAEIRRWDRVTGTVTTYPLGDFLPVRFHVLPDGELLVSGLHRADWKEGVWPVLRYVLPSGTWHALALPSFGKADLPFWVVGKQMALVPLLDADGLFAVPFGSTGFGTPTPLVSGADGLKDTAGAVHAGMAIAAPQSMGNERYILDRGRPDDGPWWSGPNALMHLVWKQPALVNIPLATPRFFRIDKNYFYVAGEDAAGIHRLIRAQVMWPQYGIDLLGGANIRITDFLVRDQQLFFTGIQNKTPRAGWIDLAAGNAVHIVATPSDTPLLYPYWSGGQIP